MSDPDLSVVDRPDAGRYELHLDGELVGLADYRLSDGVVTIPHVETDPAHRGQGFAARLMAGIVDDVRTRDLRIRPVCPYAVSYLREHPDDGDVVAG